MENKPTRARRLARPSRPYRLLALVGLLVGVSFGAFVLSEQTAFAQRKTVGIQPRPERNHNARREVQIRNSQPADPLRGSFDLPPGALRADPPGFRRITASKEVPVHQYIEKRVVNPDTGKAEVQTETKVVMTTQAVTVLVPQDASREVQEIIARLLPLQEDGPERSKLDSELRTLVENKFDKTHDRQAAEIEKTEARLASLKQTHQNRGENKDKIVQRRINSLLGETDELAWIPSNPTTPPGSQTPMQTWTPVPDGRFSKGFQLQSSDTFAPNSKTQPVPELDLNRPRINPTAPRWANDTTTQPSTAVPVRPNPSFTVQRTFTKPPTAVRAPTNVQRADQFGRSGLKEIFELARNASTAQLAIELSNTRLNSANAKMNTGEADENELAAANITLKQAKRNSSLFRRQIEAMRSRLKAEIAHAESLFGDNERRIVDYKASQEKSDRERLLQALGKQTELRKFRNDANSNLEQFEIVITEISQETEVKHQKEIKKGETIEGDMIIEEPSS